VKIAVENWQKNSPEDCRRLGDKIFVNSYQPKDLPWRNCKKKERMEAAQLISKQVDHVTGNEIQVKMTISSFSTDLRWLTRLNSLR
jgi:hypothetical protein